MFTMHYELVAVCCRMLQCVAVYCSVLQCIAVCCSVLQCVAVCLPSATKSYTVELQHATTYCNTLQHTGADFLSTQGYDFLEPELVTKYGTKPKTIEETVGMQQCSTMQHTATHCNTLQHAVTRCNTLYTHTMRHSKFSHERLFWKVLVDIP